MQLLKAVLVTLVIVLFLTSDTALRSTAEIAQCSSTSWSNYDSDSLTPKSLVYRGKPEMNRLRRELSDLP